jgi:hypothetical protein
VICRRSPGEGTERLDRQIAYVAENPSNPTPTAA